MAACAHAHPVIELESAIIMKPTGAETDPVRCCSICSFCSICRCREASSWLCSTLSELSALHSALCSGHAFFCVAMIEEPSCQTLIGYFSADQSLLRRRTQISKQTFNTTGKALPVCTANHITRASLVLAYFLCRMAAGGWGVPSLTWQSLLQ